jgi:hypothetical protein
MAGSVTTATHYRDETARVDAFYYTDNIPTWASGREPAACGIDLRPKNSSLQPAGCSRPGETQTGFFTQKFARVGYDILILQMAE